MRRSARFITKLKRFVHTAVLWSSGVLALVLAVFGVDQAAFALVLIPPAVMWIGAARSARRCKVAQERVDNTFNITSAEKLTKGNVVLAGNVSYLEGRELAMRVELTQHGHEYQQSGNWLHTWAEVSRKLSVNPFDLLLDDETRVRVEPDAEGSQLFDEFESKVIVRADAIGETGRMVPARLRVATLLPDERVWVAGKLEEHGEGERAWRLRGDPHLVVSSVPLSDHYQMRAQMHKLQSFAYLGLSLPPLLLLGVFMDRLLGEAQTGRIQSVRLVHDRDQRTIVRRYEVTVTHPLGSARHEIDAKTRSAPPVIGEAQPIWLGTLSSNLGDRPILSHGEIALAFGVFAMVLLGRCGLVRHAIDTLPWYRSPHKKLIESGAGHLRPKTEDEL